MEQNDSQFFGKAKEYSEAEPHMKIGDIVKINPAYLCLKVGTVGIVTVVTPFLVGVDMGDNHNLYFIPEDVYKVSETVVKPQVVEMDFEREAREALSDPDVKGNS